MGDLEDRGKPPLQFVDVCLSGSQMMDDFSIGSRGRRPGGEMEVVHYLFDLVRVVDERLDHCGTSALSAGEKVNFECFL